MTIAALVGAFLRQHHPDLLNEFLDSTQDTADGFGAEFGQDDVVARTQVVLVIGCSTSDLDT